MLEPLPPDFADTVASLHLVAAELVAPARKPQNEIALVATAGGFGTPPFEYEGARRQVRVEDAELVHDCDGEERRAPLTSLASGGEAVAELLPADAEPSAAPLTVDVGCSRSLAAFYGFGAAILERLREAAAPGDDPTPAYLWPEHFDLAIELGSEERGARANYGFSPGDEQHAEPYVYVGPWSAKVEGELWNARGFAGAELPYAALLAAGDQEAAAMEFVLGRRDALAALTG